MTRRLLLSMLVLAALAVAGCGGGDSGSEASLDNSLGYFPKNAPLVLTVESDLESEQYKNLDAMLKKFPFTGQLKTQIKQSMAQAGADYDKDVKPILGEELVFGVTDARSLVDDSVEDRYLIAFPADGDKLKELLEKDRSQRKSGQIDGTDTWESADGSILIVKGDTLVGASQRADLEAALERHEGDDKLTEQDFDAPFEGLPTDAMMRVYGDAQAMLTADPSTAQAREIKWVDGLRKFGFTATAQKNALAVDGRVITEGLAPEDVPLAVGDEAPPVARFGDFATAQRDAGHAIDWIFDAAAKGDGEDPAAIKAQLGKVLGGIDVDRDLLEQFSGSSTVAGQLDGTVAMRSDVKDPDAMRATLAKIRKSKGGGDLRISPAGDLLKATDEDGEELYFGMEGDVFVASQQSPARAKALAGVDPRPLDGAKGALVFVADGETIAKTVIQRSGQNQAAGLFTGPIGDVSAWVSAAPDGMRMTAKLNVE